MLSLATQNSDNPDLRDRGYIYWRLLSTDPSAAKDVVLCEKPLISEETDLLEPTLLDELIGHIASLASVYHKPPSAFVEGRTFLVKRPVPVKVSGAPSGGSGGGDSILKSDHVSSVIPNHDSLIGDLLSLDIGGPQAPTPAPAPTTSSATVTQNISNVDLLSGNIDILVWFLGLFLIKAAFGLFSTLTQSL